MAPSTAAPAAHGLLASLDAEQRAAAMLPDGPAQIIAPAGSGKTTTLIARLGVLLDRGVAADRIGVVTFNRDAAAELTARIASRLAPHVPGAAAIEVRTLHAMARQVLIDAGRPVRLVPDRLPLLRAARRRALTERPVVGDGDDPPPEPPDRWQARFSHLCVDEFQDVDAAQLRLVRILAAPEDNLFVVGDDDQP